MRWRPGVVQIRKNTVDHWSVPVGAWYWVCCPVPARVVGLRECRWGWSYSWRMALRSALRHVRMRHGKRRGVRS